MLIALIVVVAIIVIAVLYYIGKRNSIIASRNRVDPPPFAGGEVQRLPRQRETAGWGDTVSALSGAGATDSGPSVRPFPLQGRVRGKA